MADNSVDTDIKRSPLDFLAPISGEIPHLLLLTVYAIAIVVIFLILKSKQNA